MVLLVFNFYKILILNLWGQELITCSQILNCTSLTICSQIKLWTITVPNGYTTFRSGSIPSGRFGLAVSVWAVSVWAVSVWPIQSGRFGLAVSVTGHFGRDVSVHKELMKFVNVNGYLGRIIIFLYNTIQIKTWQFALPKARSNSWVLNGKIQCNRNVVENSFRN